MKKLIIAAAFILLSGTLFSQTLQKGSHFGLQALKITLDPDVTMNQYLDFTMNTFIPEAEKHFPGMKAFVVGGGMEIGSSEEAKVEYSIIYFFESAEVFNKFFDAEGNPHLAVRIYVLTHITALPGRSPDGYLTHRKDPHTPGVHHS